MRQVPPLYYHDLSNSHGGIGALRNEDEIDEEDETEDKSCYDSDDDESCYSEEGGSDIGDDALDSINSDDSIYNDERPLHGPLTNENSHNFHVRTQPVSLDSLQTMGILHSSKRPQPKRQIPGFLVTCQL